MYVSKRNPREEYRLKQRERIEASSFIAQKHPELKQLKLTLEYYDATGTTKNGEVKCKLNLERAKAVLLFACPGMGCLGGDFDLSEALATAVVEKCKVAKGELRCQGSRKRGDGKCVPCPTLLRYKLNLDYD